MGYSLNEEIICDHIVTTDVKKLWNIELDILEKFKNICSKYQLSYFAGAGTMLGAARHQGFIPWDDDIDLYMFVDDYLKFLKCAGKELEYPYYLYSWKVADFIGSSHIRIRRSDTTGCTRWELECCPKENNKGIFIDIFPICNVPDSFAGKVFQRTLLLPIKAGLAGHERLGKYIYSDEKSVKEIIDIRIIIWKLWSIFVSYQELNTIHMKVCTMVKKNTKYIGLTTVNMFDKRLIWERDIFNGTVELPFADTTISCPKNWEEYLRIRYGNWKEIVKNTSCHEMYLFDAATPYTEMIG